jgi:hypothetical protein
MAYYEFFCVYLPSLYNMKIESFLCVTVLLSVASLAYSIFPRYLISGTIFKEKSY